MVGWHIAVEGHTLRHELKAGDAGHPSPPLHTLKCACCDGQYVVGMARTYCVRLRLRAHACGCRPCSHKLASLQTSPATMQKCHRPSGRSSLRRCAARLDEGCSVECSHRRANHSQLTCIQVKRSWHLKIKSFDAKGLQYSWCELATDCKESCCCKPCEVHLAAQH